MLHYVCLRCGWNRQTVNMLSNVRCPDCGARAGIHPCRDEDCICPTIDKNMLVPYRQRCTDCQLKDECRRYVASIGASHMISGAVGKGTVLEVIGCKDYIEDPLLDLGGEYMRCECGFRFRNVSLTCPLCGE